MSIVPPRVPESLDISASVESVIVEETLAGLLAQHSASDHLAEQIAGAILAVAEAGVENLHFSVPFLTDLLMILLASINYGKNFAFVQ